MTRRKDSFGFLKAGLVGLALVLAVPAAGQDFQKGHEAYVRGDYSTALREWRPLAEQGDVNAQAFLGSIFARWENYAEAAKWYRLAAEQGSPSAQAGLGALYSLGHGVPQNYAEAAKWTHLAAEQGDVGAQASLGTKYILGEGVPENYVQAHMWLNLAIAQGALAIEKLRDDIASLMTPAQISEAQRLAKEWLEKHPQ